LNKFCKIGGLKIQYVDFLWNCLIDLAVEKFYIQKEDGTLHDKPCFIVIDDYPNVKTNRYSLWLFKVGLIGQYPSKRKVLQKVKEIVENANFPVKVFRGKHSRKPFAENKICRVDISRIKEGAYVKVFNIPEWEKR